MIVQRREGRVAFKGSEGTGFVFVAGPVRLALVESNRSIRYQHIDSLIESMLSIEKKVVRFPLSHVSIDYADNGECAKSILEAARRLNRYA